MSGYTDLTKLETSRHCLRRIARHDEQQFSKDSIVNVMEKFVKTVNIMDDTILVPCRLMDRQIGDNSDIIAAPGKDSTANQLTMSSNAQGKRGAAHSKNVHEFLSASELFNLYSMLNALKNDLLWTGNQSDAEADETEADAETQRIVTAIGGNAGNVNGVEQQVEMAKTESTAAVAAAAAEHNFSVSRQSSTATTASTTSTASGMATGTGAGTGTSVKGHMRRTSTASVASITSVSNLSDSDSDISNENDSGLESDGNKSDNAQCSDGSSSASSEINACKKSKAANMDKATDLAKRCRRHLNGLYQCLEQMTEAANYLTARYQSDIGPV